jgi:hypothetical protein
MLETRYHQRRCVLLKEFGARARVIVRSDFLKCENKEMSGSNVKTPIRKHNFPLRDRMNAVPY